MTEDQVITGGISQFCQMDALFRLIKVMETLRDPERGCAWDREQTFASLLPYTLEEVYELVDAVERGDWAALVDELGDLLFHVIFYARIGAETGAFNLDQIAAAAADKLERRHPHVFGEESPPDAGARSGTWERIKRGENRGGSGEPAGVLGSVPDALPALIRARKLQQRAASVGFDWVQWGPVLDKLEEEIGELRQLLQESPVGHRVEEEVGDILFAAVNCARHAGVDPEMALQRTNRKFQRRFAYIEKALAEQGRSPEQASLEEMDRLWEEAKTLAGEETP